MRYVGQPLPMHKSVRLARGMGRYIGDLHTRSHHACFVRSSHSHARIKSVDVSEAFSAPGVVAVYTASDIAQYIKGKYWGGFWEDFSRADYFPLARNKVRFVGEPIAVVIADSRYHAEDGAGLVAVEYDPLPAVVDPGDSLNNPPAILYENWKDNVYFHDEFSNGDVETAFASAAGIIKRTFTSQRHTGTPLETRGIIAEWDPGREQLVLQWNHQDVFVARAIVAAVLGLSQAQIHITAPDNGGGFGVKLPIYPEEIVCCVAAMLLGRPIRWIQDRFEDLLATSQHRDLVAHMEIAYEAGGRVVGLKGRYLSDAGAYGVPARGNSVEGMMVAQDMLGAYDITNYEYRLDVVMTNKPPLCVYRGVGQPISIFVMERLLDDVASATGLDRAQVRRINLVKESQFPYRSATGYVYEQGSYLECLDRALKLVGYEHFPSLRRDMRAQGRCVGLGLAVCNEGLARGAAWYGKRGVPISGQEGCSLKIDPTGRIIAELGTTNQGQGIETTMRQVVADQFDVDIDLVTILMGDTAYPYGAGAWASRQATLASTAIVQAAAQIREKLKKIAGLKLECAVDDLSLADGRVFVQGAPSRGMTIEEIAKVAYFTASDLPRDIEPALEAVSHFDPPDATFSNAAHAAIIEVNLVTGKLDFLKYVIVHDCGRVINPLIVEGQLYGGLAQGIGGTIHEHLIFDQQGQPLVGTFMDYLLPTVYDVPDLIIEHIETPSPMTGLGVKGVGESGTCFAPATIATGVADALGVPVISLKLGPSQVFELIQQAKMAVS
jgi:carbon-monoxide dehydrogenase large subunit